MRPVDNDPPEMNVGDIHGRPSLMTERDNHDLSISFFVKTFELPVCP